jgi:hypothetical protein
LATATIGGTQVLPPIEKVKEVPVLEPVKPPVTITVDIPTPPVTPPAVVAPPTGNNREFVEVKSYDQGLPPTPRIPIRIQSEQL